MFRKTRKLSKNDKFVTNKKKNVYFVSFINFMKLNLGRKVGLFHCHIRKIQKLIITRQTYI